MTNLISVIGLAVFVSLPSFTVAEDAYYVMNPHTCVTEADGLRRCPDKTPSSCLNVTFNCSILLPVTGAGCLFPDLSFTLLQIEPVGDANTTVTNYIENTSSILDGNGLIPTLPAKVCYKERFCGCRTLLPQELCVSDEFADIYVLVAYTMDLNVFCRQAAPPIDF